MSVNECLKSCFCKLFKIRFNQFVFVFLSNEYFLVFIFVCLFVCLTDWLSFFASVTQEYKYILLINRTSIFDNILLSFKQNIISTIYCFTDFFCLMSEITEQVYSFLKNFLSIYHVILSSVCNGSWYYNRQNNNL